jgi:hypothetical protein
MQNLRTDMANQTSFYHLPLKWSAILNTGNSPLDRVKDVQIAPENKKIKFEKSVVSFSNYSK